MKRLREQEDSRYLSENEQRKQEEERKRREEEQQRQFESPINMLIRGLKCNDHIPYICLDSVPINSVEIRLLSQALAMASSCKCLVLHSKSLCDEDGDALASGISVNKSITHVNLDRNRLGLRTLLGLAKCIRSNNYLEFVSLEGNNLTQSGTSFGAFKEFIDAVSSHHFVQGLNLSHCWLVGPCADYVIACLDINPRITNIDMSRNDVPFEKLQQINTLLNRNKAKCKDQLSSILGESDLFAEAEADSINFGKCVERCRLEIEVREKRRIRDFWERVAKYKTLLDIAELEKTKVMQNLLKESERAAPVLIKTKTKKK